VPLGEHGVRLPDPGSGPKVNAQLPARRDAADDAAKRTAEGVIAGMDVAQMVFREVDASLKFRKLAQAPVAIEME